MIFFLTTRANDYPIRSYLRGYGTPLAGRVVPVPYERLLRTRRPRAGTYVFADVELLGDAERARAAAAWDVLAARGCRLLNHPVRSMRRIELLQTLHARGINDFTVHGAAGDVAGVRFPAFVRVANDHGGSLTPLLRDAGALRAALDDLPGPGGTLDDKVVVEFSDTADAAGVYRKYSAFRVGDRIIPRHVFVSRDWHVQSWDVLDDAIVREELAFVARNPHGEELRRIFELARIEWGRIDYGITRDGRLRVWEINTNPTIVWPAKRSRRREAVHAAFATMLLPAFVAIDSGPQTRSLAAWARTRAPDALVRAARRLLRAIPATGGRGRG